MWAPEYLLPTNLRNHSMMKAQRFGSMMAHHLYIHTSSSTLNNRREHPKMAECHRFGLLSNTQCGYHKSS
jgi:hypothetical protein